MTTTPRVPTGTKAVWLRAAIVIVGFIALLWILESIDSLLGQPLNDDGVRPRDVGGLWGILWAPLLHGGFDHLVSNTGPLLVLGFITLLSGIARWLLVTATTWLVGGLGVWLTAPSGSSTIGASILVFGWLAYLLVRGVLNRSIGQILLGVALFVVYGGLLWGVLPTDELISWQGHLFGAVGGVLAAVLLARRGDRRTTTAPGTASV